MLEDKILGEELLLRTENAWDHPKIMEINAFAKERGFELTIFDVEWYCIQRCQQLLKERGPTGILSIRRLLEAVLPKTDESDPKAFEMLVQTLRDKLLALNPAHKLILVDSYLFPRVRDRRGYLEMFEDILSPVINQIQEVKFITSSDHFDSSLWEDVKQILQRVNPRLSTSYALSNHFHDRFWIVDESRGLFVGTSLNGLGKRYALVDNISEDDTRAIITELKSLSLI